MVDEHQPGQGECTGQYARSYKWQCSSADAKIAKLEEGNQQVKDQVCNLQVQMEARKNHQSNSD